MKFSIQAFFSKCEQIRRNLVTFTEEFLYEKLHFLCSAGITLMENFIYFAVLVSEAVSFLNHFEVKKAEKSMIPISFPAIIEQVWHLILVSFYYYFRNAFPTSKYFLKVNNSNNKVIRFKVNNKNTKMRSSDVILVSIFTANFSSQQINLVLSLLTLAK